METRSDWWEVNPPRLKDEMNIIFKVQAETLKNHFENQFQNEVQIGPIIINDNIK